MVKIPFSLLIEERICVKRLKTFAAVDKKLTFVSVKSLRNDDKDTTHNARSRCYMRPTPWSEGLLHQALGLPKYTRRGPAKA